MYALLRGFGETPGDVTACWIGIAHPSPMAGGPTPPATGCRRDRNAAARLVLAGQSWLAAALSRRCSMACRILKIEHHSLCSSTGIPHSTQIRTRFGGSVLFRPRILLSKDMAASVTSGSGIQLRIDTRAAVDRFPGSQQTTAARQRSSTP